jgi:transketolase
MSLETICKIVPEMLGGSADLTGSNLTDWSGSNWINYNKEKDINCNYISYGVREFGMAAIMNGIALHGGFRPYGGTFLVFSDYARNAIRMSALMSLPVIYVMTHDSIGLGEDGPTHQPIEQISSLRLIPNINIWRPADAFETQVAWKISCEEKNKPSVLVLSRQALPALVSNLDLLPYIQKGGYILKNVSSMPDIILAATGSEVSLVMKSAELLESMNIKVRVVSLPCLEIFLKQPSSYKIDVLLKDIPIVFECYHILLNEHLSLNQTYH